MNLTFILSIICDSVNNFFGCTQLDTTLVPQSIYYYANYRLVMEHFIEKDKSEINFVSF
jgi:hypothetical protein